MDAFEVIANKITKVPTYVLLSPYYTPILQLLPGAWCALLTTSPIHEPQTKQASGWSWKHSKRMVSFLVKIDI